MYKTNKGESERQLITVEQMSHLANSILVPRNKAIILVLAKTGIRRGELLSIDIDDIDWNLNSIKLKPKPKRSNLTVFFDEECGIVLKRWIKLRNQLKRNHAYLQPHRQTKPKKKIPSMHTKTRHIILKISFKMNVMYPTDFFKTISFD